MPQLLASNWQWMLLLVIAAALLTVFFVAKPVRAGLRTLAIIVRLGISYKKNTGEVPSGVLVDEVQFCIGNRTILANLYRPDDKKLHPALILAHGAIKGGKEDRALRFGGQSLAGAGFIALIPQLEHLNRLRLHRDDVDALAACVEYLSKQDSCSGKIGLMGVCLSAPLVFLAAARPEVKQNVAVITCWGGFYNINDWLQAVLARSYVDDGKTVPWNPRPLLIEEAPKWLIELTPDKADRVCLSQILAGSGVEPAKERLSASGKVLCELLTSKDAAKVKYQWQRLDPELQRSLDSLSPHTKINEQGTKIAIIHTSNDDVIPWVESVKLVNAIDAKDKIFFRIFHQFYHVSIEDFLKARFSNVHHVISEVAGFYMYMYSILYQLF